MKGLQMQNKQEQKEIRYRQAQNAKNKMRWQFCRCGMSKRKCIICRRGMLKAKYDGGFADAECGK